MTGEAMQPFAVEATIELVQASKGKRLANYLIDLCFFYLVFMFWAVLAGIFAPALLSSLEEIPGAADRLFTLIFYAIFMGFVEMIFRGKSLGKMITGTRVVNDVDGSEISSATAFLRGFYRAVPFDAFSALGTPCYPWHDRWSKTLVIDVKETNLANAPAAEHP